MIDWGRLRQIFEANVADLYALLARDLKRFDYQVITNPGQDYLVGVPKVIKPIVLVAHLDTIARKGMNLTLDGTILRNARGVLGADDRAGVYAIMRLIEVAGQRPLVIFTTGEESGGVGVKILIRDKVLDPYLNQIGLFIELDRRGACDFVYYSASVPDSLKEWAESYGYKEDYGSYSDVADLTWDTTIGHLNLSIGYEHEHTPSEELDIAAMEANITRVHHMLMDKGAPHIRLTEDEMYYRPLRPAVLAWDNYHSWSFGADDRDAIAAEGIEGAEGAEWADYWVGRGPVEESADPKDQIDVSNTINDVLDEADDRFLGYDYTQDPFTGMSTADIDRLINLHTAGVEIPLVAVAARDGWL